MLISFDVVGLFINNDIKSSDQGWWISELRTLKIRMHNFCVVFIFFKIDWEGPWVLEVI